MKTNTKDMTVDNPLRLILGFSVPLFLSTLLQQAYSIGDMMVTGYNLGDSAIAAIGASCSFYSLIINFSWTLNGGHGIVVALAATSDPTVIANAVMSLHVNFVFFPALGIPLCLRAAMQSMGHKIAPLFSSSLELVIKVASSLWVIPVHGYLTASFTEPVIWLACAVLLACIFLAHPFVGTSTTKEAGGPDASGSPARGTAGFDQEERALTRPRPPRQSP